MCCTERGLRRSTNHEGAGLEASGNCTNCVLYFRNCTHCVHLIHDRGKRGVRVEKYRPSAPMGRNNFVTRTSPYEYHVALHPRSDRCTNTFFMARILTHPRAEQPPPQHEQQSTTGHPPPDGLRESTCPTEQAGAKVGVRPHGKGLSAQGSIDPALVGGPLHAVRTPRIPATTKAYLFMSIGSKIGRAHV